MPVWILFFSLVLVSGCVKSSHTSQNSPSPQGTQDVGGGNTLLSTDEDVVLAVNNARSLLRTFAGPTRAHSPLYKIIESLRGTDLEEIAQKVFYPQGWPSENQIDISSVYSLSSYFENNNVKLVRKGSCPSADNKHADASATVGKIDSDICMSIENLKKIPKTSLFREVIGLFIHECAHIVGLGEDDAVKLQKKINEEMLEVETFFDTKIVVKTIRKNLAVARQNLKYTYDLYHQDPTDPRVRYWANETVTLLTWMMPNFKYPLLFQGGMGKDYKQLVEVLRSYRQVWSALFYHFGDVKPAPGKPKNLILEYYNIVAIERLALKNDPPGEVLFKCENILKYAEEELNKIFPTPGAQK